ncbi:DUF5131 family protein [Pirellulaceae bacterium SH449]
MKDTKIEWATHTFNHIRGCTKISEGCAHCYAAELSKRNPKTLGIWGPNGTRVLASEAMWREPIKWNREYELHCQEIWENHGPTLRRPRVFCASLADVFEDWKGPIVNSKGEQLWINHDNGEIAVAGEFKRLTPETAILRYLTMDDVRRRLFALIDATPNLDYLLLTKRPENILRMWPNIATRSDRQLLEEVRVQITGFPDYEISNLGIVYSLRGSNHCCFCGESISGITQKRYCGQKCRQASHYCRSKGIADKFECEAKPLNGDIGEDGHTRVTLYNDGESSRFLIHRLVLTMFSGPSSPTDQGRHLDGNPRNNRIDNLEWGSQSRNWDDSKRHGTHRRYSKLSQIQVDQIKSEARMGETPSCLALKYDVSTTQIYNILSGKQWKHHLPHRSNVFLGTTVENQEQANKRIPHLLDCRDLSPVLFLSCEPLLGKVDLWQWLGCPEDEVIKDNPGSRLLEAGRLAFGSTPQIDWIITGGESGRDARPMHPDWARSLRDQCQAAGVAFHFKQWGEWHPYASCNYATGPNQWRHGKVAGLSMLRNGSICLQNRAECPSDKSEVVNEFALSQYHRLGLEATGYQWMHRVGKKAAGRLLDGREWNEVPNHG